MFKFFFRKTHRSAAADRGADNSVEAWTGDLLAHPDIEAMDERQRADLPFPGYASAHDGGKPALPCCET